MEHLYFFSRIMGRGDGMTIHEASERYHIPLEILREYERWGLCGTVKTVMGAWQYDDTDLERLSMIMTLHDVGFENAEIETYMKLLLEQEGTEAQRLQMLDEKRGRTGLTLAQREMITFCFLAAQGGCEPQLTSHAKGNMNLGNGKDFLIRVVPQCLPYIGYPRSLNAVACVNKAAED